MYIKAIIGCIVFCILVAILFFCIVELFFRILKKKRDRSVNVNNIDTVDSNDSDKRISSYSNVGKSILKAKEDMRSKK